LDRYGKMEDMKEKNKYSRNVNNATHGKIE
jgi:hypothetical protein